VRQGISEKAPTCREKTMPNADLARKGVPRKELDNWKVRVTTRQPAVRISSQTYGGFKKK